MLVEAVPYWDYHSAYEDYRPVDTQSLLGKQTSLLDVVRSVENGDYPLLLTERRKHAEQLADLLTSKGIRTAVLRGAMRVKERQAANQQYATAQVIVATGKYVGEGFDLPRLNTLFLALPISWKGSLAQYAGRIHRESEGKDQVTIYDYVDCALPMLERMFLKRKKGYSAMGYSISYSDQESHEGSSTQLRLTHLI